MRKLIRNVVMPLSLIIIIIFSVSIQIDKSQATETCNPDDVLVFLEDVVKLDLSKYSIELSGTAVSHPSELGGLCQITGKYTLQSTTNNITVLFKFRNGTLSWCLVRVKEGTPQYGIDIDDNI